MNCLFLGRNKEETIIIFLSQKNIVLGTIPTDRTGYFLKENCQSSVLASLESLPFHDISRKSRNAKFSDFPVLCLLCCSYNKWRILCCKYFLFNVLSVNYEKYEIPWLFPSFEIKNILFYLFWGLEKHALLLTDLGHVSKKGSIPRKPA